MNRIPKKLHFIWVGDESMRPDAYIDTWRQQHPDFEIQVWGNKEWKDGQWLNRQQMERLCHQKRGLAGVADLMRWEILLNEGGFALDADSVCLRRLPDWLFECDLFAVWENEYVRPGLVANGYVGSVPGHDVIRSVVTSLNDIGDITKHFVWKKLRFKKRKVWQTTGPVPFTKAIFESSQRNMTILPSHFFLPIHHSGSVYTGGGPIYSCELFAGTKSTYSTMTEVDPAKLVIETRKKLDQLVDSAKEGGLTTSTKVN